MALGEENPAEPKTAKKEKLQSNVHPGLQKSLESSTVWNGTCDAKSMGGESCRGMRGKKRRVFGTDPLVLV